MKKWGIPYMGSKEQILYVFDEIFRRERDKKHFIDPFCGGFSVCHYALLKTNFNVWANDLNKYVIALIKELVFNQAKEIKKVWLDWVDRERFMDVRDNRDKYPDWYVGYVLVVWSFGNRQVTYLFGKDIEDLKKRLHQALVFDDWHESILEFKKYVGDLPKEYGREKRLMFMRLWKRFIGIEGNEKIDWDMSGKLIRLRKMEELEQLERVQRFERVEDLQELQQIESLWTLPSIRPIDKLKRLDSMHWKDFIQSIPTSVLQEAFVYCDPPYENKGSYFFGSIDYNEFWDWFRNAPYPVYASSYQAPQDISPLFSVPKISLFKGIRKENEKRKVVIENIYFNGVE